MLKVSCRFLISMRIAVMNQKGNALVSMVLMGSVLGAVILGIGYSQRNLDKSIARQNYSVEYQSLLRSIKMTINDPYLCSNVALSGAYVKPIEDANYLDNVKFESDIIAKKIMPLTGQDLAAGTEQGNITINRVYLRNFRYIRGIQLDPDFGAAPPLKSKYEAELIVEATYKIGNTHVTFTNDLSDFTKNEDQKMRNYLNLFSVLQSQNKSLTYITELISSTQKNIENIRIRKSFEPIDMFVQVDNPVRGEAGTIYSCFGKISEAAICENSGGAFDVNQKVTSLACNPDTVCYTKPLQSSPTCPPRYNAIYLGSNPTSGIDQYLCQRCNKFRTDL